MKKKNPLVPILIVIICLLLAGFVFMVIKQFPQEKPGEKNEPEDTPIPKMEWLSSVVPNSDFKPDYLFVENGSSTTSIFSWSPYFYNEGAFLNLAEPLLELNINRVYQQISLDKLLELDTVLMMRNFTSIGIEVVLTTGDSSWLWDGIDQFKKEIKAINDYNETIGASFPVKSIAIDAESYTRSKWKEDPEKSFKDFTKLMAKAKEYANKYGIKVIQIIPEHFDTISESTFREFVDKCCDELSVMNYKKDVNISSVWNEVLVCRELGKPVETLFETMKLSEKYSVTEEKTYFYDGMEALNNDASKMIETYGTSIGIGYHHYDTIQYMLNGNSIVFLYPYSNSKDKDRTSMGQPYAPGMIHLIGDDGSVVTAYAYWPYGRTDDHEYCYLATEIKSGVNYSVTVLDTPYTCNDIITLSAEDKITETIGIHFVRK